MPEVSMVKVYKPVEPLQIPQELLDEVKNTQEGTSARHKADQAVAAYVSEQLSQMRMEEIEPGKPKHITTSKLPLNTRDKPIGRKDWLHKK